jgi:FlaA1/EpsC-like NDP-sugar epimerase
VVHNLLLYMIGLSRIKKQIFQIFCDVIFFLTSFLLALVIQNEPIIDFMSANVWFILTLAIIVNLSTFSILGLYRTVIRYISTESIKYVGIGILNSAVCIFIFSQILEIKISINIILVFCLLLFLLSFGTRTFLKQIYTNSLQKNKKSIAIYGAGNAGLQILNAISGGSDYSTKIFIDDNENLIGRRISGINVYSMSQAEKIFSKNYIDVLLIAIPNLSQEVKKRILNQVQKYPMQIKVIPSFKDLIEGTIEVNDLKTLSIIDLLGRDIVKPDLKLMSKNINNKVVLVTGAGGSIGSEICRQSLKYAPKKLILLDISEAAIFSIHQEIIQLSKIQKTQIEVLPLICSVQNKQKIRKILEKFDVETIFHSAAYKHVPLVESNVVEAVKNNIFGTKSLGEMAIKAKVKNFILISSDKAVRPTNFMGATKRFSEVICQNLATQKITNFSMVRFGNVIGSSGSVIPHFNNQIDKGGPVTVTHNDITRFFMTIPEAAQLVIQASSMSSGNDIFILDMGKPVKIIDLAFKMIHLRGLKPFLENSYEEISGDIGIKISGLRPGEKLYEELLISENSIETNHPKIFKEKLSYMDATELDNLIVALSEACKINDINKIREVFSHPKIMMDHSGEIIDQMI